MKPILGILIVFAAISVCTGGAYAAADGKALYNTHCKKCHGENGEGNEKIAKMMKAEKPETLNLKSPIVVKMSDAELDKVSLNGARKMKGLEGKISAEEATAITAYVRTLQK